MNRTWYRALAILAAAVGIVALLFKPGGASNEQVDGGFFETQQTQSQSQPSEVVFPYTLPEGGLVVEGTVNYCGTYWEDDSQEAVTDITGLMVYNPGKRMVRFGAIALEQGGETLYFFVYCLPPGGRCLVLEKNRHPYTQRPITECRELTMRWDYQQLHSEQLCYIGFGEKLTLVNHSSKQQRHVTLWYKQYDHEGEYFLGGVAYCAHVFRLNAQEQRVLTPEYYHAGHAKVVAIELEES